MNNALVFINTNKIIDIYDYLTKLQPLKKNQKKYKNIYFIFTNSQFLCENLALNNREEIIELNLNILIKLGFNNSYFIRETDVNEFFKFSNHISNYIYLSKIIKNPYIKNDFQNNCENSIKLSNIFSLMTLISEILLVDCEDIYCDEKFSYVYEVANKILKKYNEYSEVKLTLPNLIYNKQNKMTGLDGNINISDRFDNDFELTASKEKIKQRVNTIYTDPNHININDKGNTDNNPLFTFIDLICSNSNVKKFFNLKTISDLKNNYRNGGIGDAKLKDMLFDSIYNKICKKLTKNIKINYTNRLADDVKKLMLKKV